MDRSNGLSPEKHCSKLYNINHGESYAPLVQKLNVNKCYTYNFGAALETLKRNKWQLTESSQQASINKMVQFPVKK